MPRVRPAASVVRRSAGQLQAVKCLDPRRGEVQRRHQLGRNAGDRRIDLGRGDAQPIGGRASADRSARCSRSSAASPSRADIGNDRRHRLIDAFRGLARLVEQGGERGLEAGIGRGEPDHVPERGAEAGDPGADRLGLRLQRGAVDDQPAR